MVKKFRKIFENAAGRYERGGFLEGDCIVLRKNYKRCKVYQNAPSNVKDILDQMAGSDLNLRVVGLKQKNPSNYYQGNTENLNDDIILTVALDIGGGRYTQLVNISPDMVDGLDHKPNLPPIPDSLKRKSPVNIKPEPLEQPEEQEEQHKAADSGPNPGTTSSVDAKLPTSNTPMEYGAKGPTQPSYMNPVNWK